MTYDMVKGADEHLSSSAENYGYSFFSTMVGNEPGEPHCWVADVRTTESVLMKDYVPIFVSKAHVEYNTSLRVVKHKDGNVSFIMSSIIKEGK